MIISLLMMGFFGFINLLFGLLPTTGLPSALTSGITNFFNYVYQFNGIFPIDTAITLLGYTAVFWGIVFAWDFFKWLIHLLRGN